MGHIEFQEIKKSFANRIAITQNLDLRLRIRKETMNFNNVNANHDIITKSMKLYLIIWFSHLQDA